jgi:rhodanese-related sulfurtransferase
MTEEQLSFFLPLALVFAFFAWRTLKFKTVKARIPGLLEKGAIVVDVRNPGEFQSGANPLSLNIPLGQIETRARELDRTKPIILCCASGARSAMAASILRKNGFEHVINAGPWPNTI